MREQAISSRRQKLSRDQKLRAKKLLASPERSQESSSTARSDDISTARSDDISTARTDETSTARDKKSQIHRESKEIQRKNRKSHQTARSIVEEDLKQRLQQLDFKLTPEEIPSSKSEKSKTPDDSSRAVIRILKPDI
ncbi:unnamed protein product [Onchocerca ochengi]|uniref:Pre-mRNA-splicing factor CWC22 homolog n=1 Tax=Onchocerca ochengi TaxID=42157 RepID=A0A182EPE5_ONCOC|nr:unnamed protein product [Onchocerca ochengi]